MHTGKLLFAQLMEHLPPMVFELANANATRDWRIYAAFAKRLLGVARKFM